MILAHTIDANGYIIEPVLVPDDTQDSATVVVTRCPDGFYKPQWVTGRWVEGEDPTVVLNAVKVSQKAQIDSSFNAVLAAGVQSGADGNARTYSLDSDSRQKLSDVRAIPETAFPPQGLGAKLQNGTYVLLSYPQMQQLVVDGQTAYLTNEAKQVGYHQQIDAAMDTPTVQSINWQ